MDDFGGTREHEGRIQVILPNCTSKLEVVGNFARQLLESVLVVGNSDDAAFLGS